MRRYFQFSLRTLFILTTLVAVAICLPAAIERYHEYDRWVTQEQEERTFILERRRANERHMEIFKSLEASTNRDGRQKP